MADRELFQVGDVVVNDDSGCKFRIDVVHGPSNYDVATLPEGYAWTHQKLHNCSLFRRSAPPKEQGPVVMSAEGKPIRVGDRLEWDVPTTPRLHCVVIGIRDNGVLEIQFDGGDTGVEQYSTQWFHAPPPAAGKGQTNGEVLDRWKQIEKTPGGSEDAVADQGRPLSQERPAQAPGPSLADFTAAVNEHLLPRLPKGFKAITDIVRGRNGWSGPMVNLWVFDASGAELYCESQPWPCKLFGPDEARGVSSTVAIELMSRQTRTDRGGK